MAGSMSLEQRVSGAILSRASSSSPALVQSSRRKLNEKHRWDFGPLASTRANAGSCSSSERKQHSIAAYGAVALHLEGRDRRRGAASSGLETSIGGCGPCSCSCSCAWRHDAGPFQVQSCAGWRSDSGERMLQQQKMIPQPAQAASKFWRIFAARAGQRGFDGDESDRNDREPIDGRGNGGQERRVDVWQSLLEPITPVLPENPHKSLINEDFAPALPQQRTFSVWDLASLWVGLVVGIPTYYMAGSLVEMGMAWWQGILTVVAGNVIVLVPMVLSGHGGTKYGIPFPVLARAAFGIRGANVPSLLRALVGCGWFGIQTWIGGQAIFQLFNAITRTKIEPVVVPALGTSFPELACFLFFWAIQVGIVWDGIESIREMEKYCAPVLIVLSVSLLGWAFLKAGGFGPMLATPSQFGVGGAKEGRFWEAFFPALTANIGFWATLSLNIPDFTRFARSQADQLLGQAVGLPLSMAAFTFVGLAVTSATVVIFGRVISDPIEVLSLMGSRGATLLALVGVILATLTTNIAANIVAPANALVNIDPSALSFRKAALFTAALSVALAPWRLVQSTQGFIFTWLIGYSALMGPIGGIIIVDYFVLRRRRLDISALYSVEADGQYWYTGGFNLRAIISLVLGVLPNIPGFLQSARLLETVPWVFSVVYDNSWFVGFFLSSVIYWCLSYKPKRHILSLM